MSLSTVKDYLSNIDNRLLEQWKQEADAVSTNSPFEKRMLADWLSYFDDLLDVNEDITGSNPINAADLKYRLTCEIEGTKQAIDCLKKFRDESGLCKQNKHINSLIKLLDIEWKSNDTILKELDKT